MTGMTTVPVASFELTTSDLATVDDDDFGALCRQIGREVLTPRWSALLAHPARRAGVAVAADGELVGVARVFHKAGDVTEVYLAVAEAWRRQGVATRLVDEVSRRLEGREINLVSAASDGATVHRLRPRFATPVRAAS